MLGKWNSDHMIKSYVNGVPVAAVLARAGHDNMLHLLPRSTVEPPQELLDLIFPGVEKLLADRKQVCMQIQSSILFATFWPVKSRTTSQQNMQRLFAQRLRSGCCLM